MSKNYGNDSQIAEIVKYISDTMKFPIMGAGGGFAPIGTINSYMGTTAPIGWLACDGTVYNIADYPDLATHIASHFGSTNFFGGDGTTTFGVPDLRGEFLRGSGTNSHTNQGSGANVGEHQDGTVHANGYSWGSGLGVSKITNGDKNFDKAYSRDYSRTDSNVRSVSGGMEEFTSRPTNTSVLFIIKATVSGDANAHQYSTEEQVVGKWIDGSDIYERTITGLSTKVKYDDWITIITIPSLKYIINAVAYCTESSELRGGIVGCTEWFNDGGVVKCESLVNIDLRTINIVTIQYTKTQ